MARIRLLIIIVYNETISCTTLSFLSHWLPNSSCIRGKRVAKLVNPFG